MESVLLKKTHCFLGLLTQFYEKTLDSNLTRTHFSKFYLDLGLFVFGLRTFIFLVNSLKNVIFSVTSTKNDEFYIQSTLVTPETALDQN